VTFRIVVLNVSFFKVLKNVVGIVSLKVVENYRQKVFVVFAFLGFKLEITIVARREEILTGDVTVMLYLIVLMCEWTVTVEACCGCPMSLQVVVGHGRKGNLMGKNFVYCFAFRHYVLVKTRHDFGTAIECGQSLILFDVCHSVTAKPTHKVLIDYSGFCVCIGLVDVGNKKGFKIANEIKFQRMFFIVVFEF